MKDKWKKIWSNKKYKNRILFSVPILIALIILPFFYNGDGEKKEYKKQSPMKFLQVVDSDKFEQVKDVIIDERKRTITYTLKDKNYVVNYPRELNFLTTHKVYEKLAKNDIKTTFKEKSTEDVVAAVAKVIYYLFLVLFMYYLLKMMGILNDFEVGEAEDVETTFDDIAGYRYVKEEMKKLVEGVKNPKIYEQYGIEMPKGVLFTGPPGTGKTEFARAVAGESKVKFLFISGSDIEDKYVGSGKNNVNSLFKKIKKVTDKGQKCVVFVDEIDSFATKRELKTVVETNQTINKFLTEVDGFKKNSNVLFIAATNLVETLDPAILRPGRFSRKIDLPRPNLKDREEIINLYLNKKKDLVADEVYADNYPFTLASQTEGLVGAHFKDLINEATIIAQDMKKDKIDIESLRKAFTRMIAGVQMEHQVSEEDKKIIAYHEAGHAVAYIMTSKMGYKSVAYITVTPYGESLGHVAPVSKNKVLKKISDFENEMIQLLAGRAVEDILLDGDFTSGAASDLQRVNQIAEHFVTKYGMSTEMKNVFLDKVDPSDDTTRALITNSIDKAYEKTLVLMKEHYDMVTKIAEHLLKYESIDQPELKDILEGTSYLNHDCYNNKEEKGA